MSSGFKLKGFQPGPGYKKYSALLEYTTENGTKKIKKVHFGDKRYMHYRDKVPLQLYTHLDHNDAERRRRYYSRHGVRAKKWTPKYFAHKYLW